jgi:glucokinase
LLRQHAGNISAKHIHEAAIAGDVLALEIFDYTARILGQTLADVVAITSPEAFVFFGGLAQSGDILLKPTRKYMEANLLQVFKNKVKLLQSDLPDADAAILGASALVW